MLPLEEASGLAFESMRRCKLPLARLALVGRTEAEARLWVANNMLQNVAILARDEGSNTFEHIPADTRRHLRVLPDWSGACEAQASTPSYATLCVARSELEAYLGWANAVA